MLSKTPTWLSSISMASLDGTFAALLPIVVCLCFSSSYLLSFIHLFYSTLHINGFGLKQQSCGRRPEIFNQELFQACIFISQELQGRLKCKE